MKQNLKVIGVILLFTLAANLWGFWTSTKRQRDIWRVLDIGKLESGLKNYFSDYGNYPLATDDGRLIACRNDNTGLKISHDEYLVLPGYKKPQLEGLVACEWGKDGLVDVLDPGYPAYLDPLPSDTLTGKGWQYRYVSDGKTFTIYARLEFRSTEGYDRKVLKRKVKCGRVVCNFARSS